jgi:DNA ligase-associated metallophosphoesterase
MHSKPTPKTKEKRLKQTVANSYFNPLISVNTNRFEIVLGCMEKLARENKPVLFEFEGICFEFLKERALWISELSTLLIADLHFGKAAHFRKSGIPIPEPIHDEDLIKLSRLHEKLRPAHTFFLGDLFHSDWNEQWELLNSFLGQLGETTFHLVRGNHDILSSRFYDQSNLNIHKESVEWGKFILSHEPMNLKSEGMLNICGHLHPGVRLTGKARQSVRIPCFFLSNSQLILPAFGNFTGLAMMQPKENDKIWAIAGEKIIPILSGTSIG